MCDFFNFLVFFANCAKNTKKNKKIKNVCCSFITTLQIFIFRLANIIFKRIWGVGGVPSGWGCLIDRLNIALCAYVQVFDPQFFKIAHKCEISHAVKKNDRIHVFCNNV